MRPTAQPTFLLISDARDDALREALNPLAEAGARVDLVPDVYSGMARLAKGQAFDRVLVDVRMMDSPEIAFVQLAPRYFPEARVEIPWLAGTSQTLVRLNRASLPTVEMATIIATVVAERELLNPAIERAAVVSRAGAVPEAVEAPVAPVEMRAPLSTDGARLPDADEPSLHDAVRMRMTAGAEAVPPTRRPPTRTPPGSSPSAGRKPQVSAEELESLLEDGADEANPGGTER